MDANMKASLQTLCRNFGLKSDKLIDLKILCVNFGVSKNGKKAQILRRLIRAGALSKANQIKTTQITTNKIK